MKVVSVLMITYNHEKFISKALDSILMQQVNFEYEIVVGEDCSTDGTREILQEYAGKHPDKFKLLLHEENIGAMRNHIETQKSCTGKYIAFLEGDDYWIDPRKLQQQVDFLENNPDYSLCFHNVLDMNIDGTFGKKTYCHSLDQTDFDLINEATFLNIPTLSTVFRNHVISFPDDFEAMKIGDWPMFMLLAEKGKFKYLPKIMGVYRKHPGGLNSMRQTHVQNANKVKAIEVVREWFRERGNDAVVRVLDKQLSKACYYQSLLLLKEYNRKDSVHYYKKLLLKTPIFSDIHYKLFFPIKLLLSIS